MEGIVFDIKEFAVFDGPGIRTTVFLKGCPLRCQWCHNPEGLSPKPELMVSTAACTHCGACLRICKHPDECVTCGECIPVCKGGLRKIAGTRWTVEALAERLGKDRDIYSETGGGVTFSGGEPLMQWDFVAAVMERLDGIHTAVETSGMASDEVFMEMMEKTDLVMMDWKVSDPELHMRYTGADQKPIRRHLETLVCGNTPFILRMPIIPGVNDNQEHFEMTAEMVEGSRMLQRVDILPYQRAAGAKYAMVGRKYKPDFDENKSVKMFPEVFGKRGISFRVFR